MVGHAGGPGPSKRSMLALPPDDELVGDLCAPKWTVNSSGRIEVEGRTRFADALASPDAGDAW